MKALKQLKQMDRLLLGKPRKHRMSIEERSAKQRENEERVKSMPFV